jgi:hypothetical protein
VTLELVDGQKTVDMTSQNLVLLEATRQIRQDMLLCDFKYLCNVCHAVRQHRCSRIRASWQELDMCTCVPGNLPALAPFQALTFVSEMSGLLCHRESVPSSS